MKFTEQDRLVPEQRLFLSLRASLCAPACGSAVLNSILVNPGLPSGAIPMPRLRRWILPRPGATFFADVVKDGCRFVAAESGKVFHIAHISEDKKNMFATANLRYSS
jgi:hypothetical protein